MAGSLALPVGGIGDALVERLCETGSKMKVGPTDGGAEVDMGPLVSRQHLEKVTTYLDVAESEGAEVSLDGRRRELDKNGFLLGPCVIDRVQPEMRVAREEIFGPVLSVVRVDDLEQAIAIGQTCEYGNGASIFTRSGYAARQFKRRFNAGMIGINVGVPAPMAWFPFTGWNRSFFGDLHIQGPESIQFYTQQKVVSTRWFASSTDSHADPIWKTSKR
jgi:malonate-semialdehyde dehydrogenase (acetylating)/methylmalonate-semialdehyde dehydrogenase